MPAVGLIPALALIAGAVLGIHTSAVSFAWLPMVALTVGVVGWRRRAPFVTVAACALGFAACGAVLGTAATATALEPSLRRELDRAYPGFAIDVLGPEPDHDPVPTRARLVEDATADVDVVSLRVQVLAVRLDGQWRPVSGGAWLSVGGRVATDARESDAVGTDAVGSPTAASWRAGRTVVAPVIFRRPSRYLNRGVPDAERDLALAGTTLFGSIKSGLLVDVVANGGPVSEAAARVRAYVRSAVHRHVTPHDELSGAVITAVLIGDRTGLPDDVRERLQAAGTYHVIAISGGNIAILVGLVLGVLWIVGVRGRPAAALTILALLAYAQVVTAGPSVWRATFMAIAYLAARLLDLRTPPWQAGATAGVVMIVADPLEIRDPGFLLTYGATLALLEAAARVAVGPRRGFTTWLLASLVASAAVEIALTPVAAAYFSRVTSAGLVLNLMAVPAMAVGQVAGMTVVLFDPLEWLAGSAGWAAHTAASLLTGSARLIEIAPWLSRRVPSPAAALVGVYYLSATIALLSRGLTRVLAGGVFAAAFVAVSSGVDPLRRLAREAERPPLRLTLFDVGQSEAVLVESRDAAWLIDSGGRPFGTTSFDIGSRVLVPAIWGTGRRSLDDVLVTHGDPDHMGGAARVLRDVPPRRLWHGIEVPAHQPMRDLLVAAVERGVAVHPLRDGWTGQFGAARVRVLHPPPPDWERPRVRNDDSVVLELVLGDVAVLLTGDIGATVERAIAPQLTPARVRILKVAHHGSRSSSSQLLLESWRPHYALISAGRGNDFGHPHPEVLRRLEAIGARVLRTDRDGQVTIESDGQTVSVVTFITQ